MPPIFLAIILTLAQYVSATLLLFTSEKITSPQTELFRSIILIPATGIFLSFLMTKFHKKSKYLHNNLTENYILQSKLFLAISIPGIILDLLKVF